jgi:hypothetical protein
MFSEFGKVNSISKAIIKYGTMAFFFLLALGTAFIAINHTILNNNMYYEFVANSIIRTSFIIFAEAVIGGLLIDYISKKN